VSSKFYVRGEAGDQNLILLDGMKIHNPFHAFGRFSVFDPDIVKTADSYTGGYPAGYGGRLSSVVDVRTKDGNVSKLSGIAGQNFLSAKAQREGPIEDQNSWPVSGRVSLFDRRLKHMLANPRPVSFFDVFFKGTLGTPTGRRCYFSNASMVYHRWKSSAVARTSPRQYEAMSRYLPSAKSAPISIPVIPSPFGLLMPNPLQ